MTVIKESLDSDESAYNIEVVSEDEDCLSEDG